MQDFYVAVGGDDSGPGSLDRPFGTLTRARDAARDVGGEVVVHLRGGVHTISEPWVLTGDDSASEGRRIGYQAYGFGTADQEEVVISGGREISDWQVVDGVWLAEIGDLAPRQLSVAGRRAERAGIDGLPPDAARTETGYTTESAAPRSWRSPADVEFVYRGVYPWTEARCPVAEVSGEGPVAITMVQPAFALAIDLYNFSYGEVTQYGPGLPSRVENDPTFLTEPGTFVVERARPGRHLLHYLPRPDEDPEHTPAVVPAVATLLRAERLRGVSFRGLTFADATWSGPGDRNGFLHYHGNSFYEGGPVEQVTLGEGAWVTVPGKASTIPAGVVFTDCRHVKIEGCRFTRIGAAGLAIEAGADLTVRGCDFEGLSAGAVTITAAATVHFEENRIRHVGLDYSGSPGIQLTDTRDCVVAQNEVSEVPHCGIVAGPGEGTRILRNRTTGTMSVLADGGGIYLAGDQGGSPDRAAVISGNVIADTRTPYNFGLYTDYGAAWVTIEENVVTGADNSAVLEVSPPLEHVVYRGNFWDADPVGAAAPPAGVRYEGNTTLTDPAELAAATATIQQRAGLRGPRR
ncbi:right-handed parallel beta-helix repeat-containing protein [Natronosporangium hydrolyticum]|uniref:Right-handed parallel beta-helix repeat-containing protein n=1 Tax=Natronosporangium hydrolyticum TaxID=2811111 RepID=A0A895YMF5_9ACTN|nr:right-handed parallel beta-helix repeat-containing protein [Natronosporangium hydrolyticum]QSB16493.1 right-handed parallel beta-helix repeat-containing protein [Natronosporangium hydrolyticum]